MGIIIVRYDAERGKAIRDGDAWPLAMQLIELSKMEGTPVVRRRYSTQNIVLALRVAVKEGLLEAGNLRVVWRTPHGTDLNQLVDRNGRIRRWPRGFMDTDEELTMRLL